MLFLGFLLKILFLFAILGAIAAVALFLVTVKEFFAGKPEEPEEEPLPRAAETNVENILSTLSVHQLQATLDYLNAEKRKAVFGYERMSQVHKEAALSEVEKINERIKMVNNALDESWLKEQTLNYSNIPNPRIGRR